MRRRRPPRACRFASACLGLVLIGALHLASANAVGDELLPADRPPEEVIDYYVDLQLQAKGIEPAPSADDSTFLRRVTLDLNGRIPTAGESKAFLAESSPEKRVQLVDRLLASPGFVRHQATEFNALLMTGESYSLRNYLLRAFEERRPWDQIFRDLIVAEEKVIPAEATDEEKRAIQTHNEAALFLKRRARDTDRLTNEVSVLLFGVNISCAQCHDHPLAEDWKQDHFYGLKSFFSRTFDNDGFLGEREFGLVKFKTTSGESRDAQLMFLTGEVLSEPTSAEPTDEQQKAEKQRLEEAKAKKMPPPRPAFSRREQLIDVALKPGDRNYLARAVVNRLFARFFGQGLVMPVDQMHSGNPPSHPELLAWLARDLQSHQYDLTRLVRAIVLSKAYARTSVWNGAERPYAGYFAVAQVRPLMPQQLATSLRVATTSPKHFEGKSPEEIESRLNGLDNSARGLANLFDTPDEDFQVGVKEALLFNNSDRISKELLAAGGDRLVTYLNEMTEPRELIEAAVWNVFSRPVAAEEIAPLEAYLASRAEQRLAACQQIVWAMLTSAEFRFNY